MSYLEDKFGEWKPVSLIGGIFWLSCFALFLIYALTNTSGFLFPDYANLMIHEAGHMFFSWCGYTIMILGGTLGELLVPFLCALFFFWKRETTGFAFSVYWFFENFPYIGAYMADARTASRPLVGSDTSDWEILFGQWNLLTQDQKIGGAMRTIGLLGMFATMAWLAYRLRQDTAPKPHSLS